MSRRLIYPYCHVEVPIRYLSREKMMMLLQSKQADRLGCPLFESRDKAHFPLCEHSRYALKFVLERLTKIWTGRQGYVR